jgi:hydroxymethylglutaryl-CoA reductase
MGRRWDEFGERSARAARPHIVRLLKAQADRRKNSSPELDPGDTPEGSESGHKRQLARGSTSHPQVTSVDFVINGVPHLISLASSDEQLIRSASEGAALVRSTGGFAVDVQSPHVVARLVLMDSPDAIQARSEIAAARDRLVDLCNQLGTGNTGGWVREIHSRIAGPGHVDVDVVVLGQGAECEGFAQRVGHFLASRLAAMARARVAMRVQSHHGEYRMVRASCKVRPIELCPVRGDEVARMMAALSHLAGSESEHAADFNRQLLGGVAAALKAKRQDYRGVVQGALAHAHAREPVQLLARWARTSDGVMRGRLAMPVSLHGLSGPIDDLSALIASVALACSLGNMRNLAERLVLTDEKTEQEEKKG